MAYYVICDDDCRYESMTKEQILAAIEQGLEQGYVSDPDSAVISKIKEIRANGSAQIWVGTEAQFNAISPAPTVGKSVVRLSEDGVLYLCSDDSTFSDLEEHIDDKSNPHKVTFAQVIGEDTVPVAKGGTGATTAAAARTNLGAAAKSHTHNASDISGGVIPVTNGGTGATDAAKARTNLGVTPANIGAAAKSHTHTKSQITDFPTSMPASDVSAWAKASKKPTYTADEVGAVSKAGDTMTGKLLTGNGSGVMADGYASYVFRSTDDKLRAAMMLSDVNRFMINQQEIGASHAERYLMPTIATGLTADVWYSFLTSKNAVTVKQGGTGATTAAGAEYAISGSMSESTDAIDDNNQFVFKRSTPSETSGVFIYKTAARLWTYIAGKIRSVFGFTSSNVLPVSNGGTGATDAATARTNLGAVSKTGDTITGVLYRQGGSGAIGLAIGTASNPECVSIISVSDGTEFNRMSFRQYGANGNRENFNLPNTESPASNANYNILTSKNAVTVKQGGTGATTKSDARKNLGIEVQTGTATVGSSGKAITFPTAFSGVPTVTANGSLQTSVRVYNVTATGCTLESGLSDNTVQWQAIYISD